MSTEVAKPKYVLNYFNRHGKVELCRLIFAAGGVEYEDNYIENLTDSDTELGFTPYLSVGKDKIPLISVICRYLASEFNLAGFDPIEKAKADAIAQSCMLLIDSFYRNVFTVEDVDQKKINLKAFWENDADNTADQIDNMINLYSNNNGDWCLGDTFTYADLFVFEVATRYFPVSNDLFTNKFERIYKIKKNVEEKSNAAKWIGTSQTQKHQAEIQREE